MSRCALGRRRHANKSCFNLEELQCMVHAWNALHERHQILDTLQMDPDALWSSLIQKLQARDERQWLQNNIFMSKDEVMCQELAKTIRYLALRPFFEGKEADLWLSQQDINHCMLQLLHGFRDSLPNTLVYLGAQPVDHFTSLPQEVKVPYTAKWGIILNTATRQEGGEHWVAIYKDDESTTLEYFDSSGHPPTKRLVTVLELMKRRNPFIKTIITSSKVHQEDEYNCGVYTILFLFLRFLSISFEKIEDENLGFVHISHFRKLLFDEHA